MLEKVQRRAARFINGWPTLEAPEKNKDWFIYIK